MNQINYLKGDATQPQANGVKIIAHVCNDLGRWGKGFVLAVSRRWKQPEAEYRKWYQERSENDFGLGSVQFVQAEAYIWIANMVGQRGIKTGSKGPPVRYKAIGECLEKVAEIAIEQSASIHMPRIGCGLAGGKWELIEPMVISKMCTKGVVVHVYDFDG